MRFSLVVGTVNRPKEISDFLDGMTRQTYQDFEVIIADQSGTGIYEPVIARFADKMTIRHVRTDIRKLRYACALGLQGADGDVVAFPDDDCIYEPDTLERAAAHLERDQSLGFVSGQPLNLAGEKSQLGRWLTQDQYLDQRTVWLGIIEYNVFYRRKDYDAIGGLDVDIGTGCYYGSADGQDLGLRILHAGKRGYFDTKLNVRHMDKLAVVQAERALVYGRGMGYVLRKNNAPVGFVMKFLVRSAGGVLVSVVRMRWGWARYFLYTLIGRVEGYCASAAVTAGKSAP